jgi:hypothetical protein
VICVYVWLHELFNPPVRKLCVNFLSFPSLCSFSPFRSIAVVVGCSGSTATTTQVQHARWRTVQSASHSYVALRSVVVPAAHPPLVRNPPFPFPRSLSLVTIFHTLHIDDYDPINAHLCGTGSLRSTPLPNFAPGTDAARDECTLRVSFKTNQSPHCSSLSLPLSPSSPVVSTFL